MEALISKETNTIVEYLHKFENTDFLVDQTFHIPIVNILLQVISGVTYAVIHLDILKSEIVIDNTDFLY